MSDRKSLDLLKQITRDATYVDRLGGGTDPNRAAGRQWDGRFGAAAGGAGIPKYDALNDRFCKFAMRRKAAAASGAGGSSMKRAARGPGQLAPLQQPRRLWGGAEMPEAPRPGTSGGPSSFRGAQPLPSPLTRSSTPGIAAAAGAAGGGARPGGPLPAGADGTPTNAMAQQQQQQRDAGASVEALVAKARTRLTRLWDELGVPDSERMAFAQSNFGSGAETSQALAAINAELQRLVDERNCAVRVEKAVEVREGFLYLLQELAERYATSSMDKERALRELHALTAPYRNASLDTVEAILKWRLALRQEQQPYLWKGVSYLHKMNSDLFFLANSRLRLLLDFEVAGNALLDPRKTAPEERGKGGGSALPPLRRAPGGAAGPRDVALKDLPKERLDRAAAALDAEADRQRALNAAASGRDGGSSGAAQLMSADEAAHARGLVSEQDERQALVSEEDAWLREQPAARSSQALERLAATKVQSAYRAYCARRFVQAKLTQHKAAVRMQSAARRFLAKLHAQTVREQVVAARRLQALQRGIAARGRMGALKHRHLAAVAIQRTYRAHAARRTTDMMRYLRDCAIAIQRVWRGHRDRKDVRDVVAEGRHEAACRIQRVWRGHVVRRDPRHNPTTHAKTVRLQAWFRGCLARKRAVNAAIARFAATMIQARWRGVLGRREATTRLVALTDASWNAQLEVMTRAAVRIQAGWRMVLAKAAVAERLAERRAADESEAMRSLAAARDVDSAARALREDSAVRIQAVFRGHLGRQRSRFVLLLHLTAIQIQRIARGRLGRKRALAAYRARLLDESLAAKDEAEPSPIREAVEAFHKQQQQQQHAEEQEGDAPPTLGPDQFPDAGVVSAAPIATATSAAAVDATDDSVADVAQRLDMDQAAASTSTHHSEDAVPTTATEDAAPEDVSAAAADTTAAPEPAAPGAAADRSDEAAASASAVPVASASAVPAAEAVATVEEIDVTARDGADGADGADATVATVGGAADGGLSRDDAATKIASFYRGTTNRRVAPSSSRQSARRRDQEARAQEGDAAARMLQSWARNGVLPRAEAARVCDTKRRQKALLGQRNGGARGSEAAYAAGLIQRTAASFLARRATKARADLALRHGRRGNASTEGRAQECDAAARIIQRAARRMLAAVAAAKAERARGLTAAEAARRQEREASAGRIQAFARGVAAKAVRAAKERERCARRKQELVQDACLTLQAFARIVAFRARLARRGNAAAAATRQERDTAARMLQEWVRDCSARKAAVRAATKPAAAADERRAREQERDYAAGVLVRVQRQVQRRVRSRDRGARLEVAAIEQERDHAAAVIARAGTPSRRSSRATSPSARAAPAGASTTSDAEVATQEAEFATASIQAAGRGFAARAAVAEASSAPQSPERAPQDEPAAAGPSPPPAAAAPCDSQRPSAAPAATASSEHLTTSPEPRRGSRSRSRSVNFSADAAESVRSRILAEPPLNTATDPDLQHEHAHAHDAPAEGSDAPAAATEPRTDAEERAAIADHSMRQSVHFDTEHVQVVETPAADDAASPTAAPAASSAAPAPAAEAQEEPVTASAAAPATTSAVAVAAPLNEYELEKRDKAQKRAAALKIQCAARQRQARGERSRRLETRSRSRAALQEADRVNRDATVAEERTAEVRAVALADERRESVAATKIQCAYRCYNARFMRKWMLERRRELQAQKAAEDFDAALNRNASTIQRAARRFISRGELRRRRRARDAERSKALVETRRLECAATKIQCAYRSYNARFEHAWRLADKQARDREEEAARAEAEAAAQAAKDSEAAEAARRERAAVTIQCAHRTAVAKTEVFSRRKAKEHAERQANAAAAAVSQRVGRGFVSRVRTHADWSKQMNATAIEEAERGMASEAVGAAIDGASPTDPSKDDAL